MENNTVSPSEMARRRRHKRKRFETTTLGLVILILAIVGLCVIIGFSVNTGYKYVKDYIGPPETPQFFENYISPVVMQDPKPFSDVNKLQPSWLLKTAIWATLNESDNSGKYAYSDDNREILPTDDISKEFAKLFGENIKPNYQTFTDNGATYEYHPKEKCYYIPMIAFDNIFSPKVKTITRGHNSVKLSVDYIPGSGWAQNPDGTVSAPPATKTMIYVLKGSRGRYTLQSVSNFTPTGSSSEAIAVSETSSLDSVPDSSAQPQSGAAKTIQ